MDKLILDPNGPEYRGQFEGAPFRKAVMKYLDRKNQDREEDNKITLKEFCDALIFDRDIKVESKYVMVSKMFNGKSAIPVRYLRAFRMMSGMRLDDIYSVADDFACLPVITL